MPKQILLLPLLVLFSFFIGSAQSLSSNNGNVAFNVPVKSNSLKTFFDNERPTSLFKVSDVSITLAPVADAYVRNGQYAAVNYGSDSLVIKGSTTSGYVRTSYLKFSLNSISNVSAAKLRIYGSNTDNTASITLAAYGVNNDTWTENNINFGNAPAAASSTALSSVGVTNQAAYYELDVTAFVQAQLAGDKTVSIVLKNPSNQAKTLAFASRENTLAPQLVITTVAGSNQLPVLAAIGNKPATVGQQLSFTASATDPDAGQSLTYSLIGAPGGAAIDPVSGAFNWTPSLSGSYPFTVRVTDNGSPALFDEESITVTVTASVTSSTLTPVADAYVRNDQYATKNYGSDSLIIKGSAQTGFTRTSYLKFSLGSISDVSTAKLRIYGKNTENTTSISLSAYGVSDDSWTETGINWNNAPVASPTTALTSAGVTGTAQYYELDVTNFVKTQFGGDKTVSLLLKNTSNQNKTLSFASREKALQPQLFITSVAGSNRPPVLTAIGNKPATINQQMTFKATATDPDAGQSLAYSLTGVTNGASIDAVSGDFTWTPSATGDFNFTIRVTDNGSPALFDDETITVTVTAPNQAPVLASIGNKPATVGQQLAFSASASDLDAGQTLTYSIQGTTNGAGINASSGAFTWTPATGGDFNFTIRVTDNGSPVLFDEETITVTVATSGASIVLTPVADAYVRSDQYATKNYGSDSLVIKGSAQPGFTRTSYLKFSLTGVSDVGSAKLRIYGKNTENATSINVSAYGVSDDSWTEPGITWNSAPPASPATVLSSVGVTGTAQYYELDVTAFVQAQLAGDGTVSILLKNSSNQNRNLSFASREKSLQPQLIITTNANTNHTPVLAPIGNQSSTIGQAVNFTATATDQDAGQNLTYSLAGATNGATIDQTLGNFSWTPTANGDFTFTIRVSDDGTPSLFDEELITITVSDPSFTNTQPTDIPNPGTVAVPVTVSGLQASIDTATFGLESVNVKITHQRDKELTLQLQSPDGKIIYLARKSPGTNFSTTFDAVSNKFIDINEIASYSGNFSGGYRPRQDLSLLNNGQNPNGTWNLIVKDDSTLSAVGTVTGVTLVFGPTPAKPLLSLSSLPIVKIYTDNGADIVDDPKIPGSIYIINNAPGTPNNVNQTTFQYQGKIQIEIRGNSTAVDPNIPKKQYGFETEASDGVTSTDVSLFGMPKQSDWILSATLSDKSLIRNVLTYQLSREMGWWASRTQYCEVMINDEYRGVFIFEEKIKKDKNRVNIEKMAITDITDPNVTGGYIFAIDDLDPGDITFQSKFPPYPPNPFKFVYPKPVDLQLAQQTYLQNYVGDFEIALHGDNFQDPVNGFRKYANDSSFIDYFLLSELSKNFDAYRFSTYFYKKRNNRIVAGPVWDFDRGYRNEETCNTYTHTGYIYRDLINCGSRVIPWWWDRLLEDTKYKQDMVCRYNTLRQTTLSLQRIYNIIDSSAAVLNAGAQQRNFIRWNIFGKYVERIPTPYALSYQTEIDTLKQWLTNRIAWLDGDIGPCTTGLMANSASNNISDLESKSIGNVYPSPFKDQLSVSLNLDKEQNVKVQLVDINGRILYQKVSLIQKGPHLIHVDVAKKQLASGLYILHINGTNINFNKKVLKE